MKINVAVMQEVEVELDESKFTPEFMEEFRQDFYQFHTIEDHAKHLAQLFARGLAEWPTSFIEGYGSAEAFGISFKTVDQDEEIIR